MGQLHIFSRNETQEQECTLLSKERCDPSQLKPKWKIWHSGWGFILSYNLVKPWITDKVSVIIQKSQKADLQIDSNAFFFPFTKICEFFSSLLLSLFQKVLLLVFFFSYSQLFITFTKIIILFKFIVPLYFSGKFIAIGSVDDLVRVVWTSSESCTHFLICSFPCFSFWNFFLFHF